MIKVLFFASLREELNCAQLEQPFEAGLQLSALVAQLIQERGEPWRKALEQDNLIRSVNQQVVTDDVELHDGDEVALFPPVTGG